MGCAYHLTHRGNHKEPVFLFPGDYVQYIELLRVETERGGISVLCYCLMPNHVHLVVLPLRLDSLSRGIGNAHRRYSRLVNRRQGCTGHLWANRFYSTPLDERHLWAAARYVELNPVRAGLVPVAADYPWSSARAHVLGVSDPLLASDRPFPGDVTDWGAWLADGLRDPAAEQIRKNTRTGRPTGSATFAKRIEETLGRSFPAASRGRPKKVAVPT